MFVQQFFIPGIAHSSYLVAGENNCAIIDPARDTERYLKAAEAHGYRITHILETHLHADFISGHLDLADVTGAKIYVPEKAECGFDHVPLRGGDEVSVDNIRFGVLETPGHTPEGVSYTATDLARGDSPVAVFTGDTLFAGDVGRPDLFPGRAQELASKLYDSLHEKIMVLPDECLAYPAHGQGSLCGRSIGAMRITTIGYEKRFNRMLSMGREELVRSLTEGMPPAPDHFSRCSEINRKGPALLRSLSPPSAMGPEEFEAGIREGAFLIDTRCYPAFAGQSIPGSINIDNMGNVSVFAGWITPPEKKVLLVTKPQYVPGILTMLRRVGIDHISGYLKGGVHSWVASGRHADHIRILSPAEVHELMERGEATILDVRSPEEYEAGHIEGAINIMVMDLRSRWPELDADEPYIVMCTTGIRASIAASILRLNGFTDISNAAGGYDGYLAYLKKSF